MNRRDRRGAFTLLEVLVALAISGFLMLLMTEMLSSVARLRQAQASLAARHDQLASAGRFLRVAVERAVPDGFGRPADGAVATLSFKTFGLPIQMAAEPFPVELAILPDPEGMRLEVRWTDPNDQQPRKQTLISGASTLHLEPRSLTPPAAPVAGNRPMDNLPDAIELQVQFADQAPYDFVFRTTSRYPEVCGLVPILSICQAQQ